MPTKKIKDTLKDSCGSAAMKANLSVPFAAFVCATIGAEVFGWSGLKCLAIICGFLGFLMVMGQQDYTKANIKNIVFKAPPMVMVAVAGMYLSAVGMNDQVFRLMAQDEVSQGVEDLMNISLIHSAGAAEVPPYPVVKIKGVDYYKIWDSEKKAYVYIRKATLDKKKIKVKKW